MNTTNATPIIVFLAIWARCSLTKTDAMTAMTKLKRNIANSLEQSIQQIFILIALLIVIAVDGLETRQVSHGLNNGKML